MSRRYKRFPRPLLVMLVLAGALMVTILPESYRKLIEPTAYAASFTVNTADDHNDGVCNGADCSLREAINAVNAGAGGDTISFNIPGGGVRTINVTSALGGLNITKAVTIDGTTQPGFTSSPLIELSGANAGSVRRPSRKPSGRQQRADARTAQEDDRRKAGSAGDDRAVRQHPFQHGPPG